jgi:hypothetical protein
MTKIIASDWRRIGLRAALTVVFGLFCVPPLIFGGYLLLCWFRIRAPSVYYVDYPYLPVALVFIGAGALCILSTLYGAWRRSFYGLLFCVPVVCGLLAIVAIPDEIPHIARSIDDVNYLSSVNSFFRVWYEANRKFPGNETEFRDALAKGPAAWQYRVKSPSNKSPYFRSGTRLPYDIVIVPNANGPRLDNVSDRPGVIYYCVSADEQEFWVTMTSLRNDISPTASLKMTLDIPEKVFVLGAVGKDYPAGMPRP